MPAIPVSLPRPAPLFLAPTLARPNPPFTAGAPGWGAFELVAHHGELDIDDNAFPVFAPRPGVVLT